MPTFNQKQSLNNGPVPVSRAGAIAVQFEGFIYAGFGQSNFAVSGSFFPADLYKYNIASGIWTTILDPGVPIKNQGVDLQGREGAFAFCINRKIYFGMGNCGNDFLLDFWCYNPAEPDPKKAFTVINAPSTPHPLPINFSIRHFPFYCNVGDTGYVGTGRHNVNPPVNGLPFICLNDFWSFDGISWKKLSNFPNFVCDSICFIIGSKIFVGGGEGDDRKTAGGLPDGPNNIFYSYDIADGPSPVWKPILNGIPGVQVLLPQAIQLLTASFAINNIGYYLPDSGGSFIDKVFRYDLAAKSWSTVPVAGSIPMRHFEFGVSTPTSTTAYIGLGGNNSGPNFNDLWEFKP